MKTKKESFESKVAKIKVRINPELNQYKDKILFPQKLEKANEMLRTKGLPKEMLQ